MVRKRYSEWSWGKRKSLKRIYFKETEIINKRELSREHIKPHIHKKMTI